MKESLLSVGIDLGTSTTQLVFSRLYIENMAAAYAVPKLVITKKEIEYKSDIYFTPLENQNTIKFNSIREIIEKEYENAGVDKSKIDTGAVIITGETARKENAKEVLEALSGFAGDFVVATAGPDLESVISGKGAGTDLYTKEHRTVAVNIDIGGGTSNLAVFENGDTVDTGCLDIGGRLIKVDKDTGVITYIAPKLLTIIAKEGFGLKIGERLEKEALCPLLKIMTDALEQSVGLRTDARYYEYLLTHKGIRESERVQGVSFSGGVAEILYNIEKYNDDFIFGDIGILLAKAIRQSKIWTKIPVIESVETIRATVVGAGSHTTEISGSTIAYHQVSFPMKNLPVLKLAEEEEQSGKLLEALKRKIDWYRVEGELPQIAVALRGEKNPSFERICTYAEELLSGLQMLFDKGLYGIVIVEADMAKVLGQTMRHRTREENPLVCLDGIRLSEGDYIDIGRPAAGGSVLPVVVKTLVFE